VQSRRAPILSHGDVVVLDNLATHKKRESRAVSQAKRAPGSCSCHPTVQT
jgi:hypothetical protein